MSISHLGALILTDPDAARNKIKKAILEARGNRKAAADALGTTHRSLYRYIERLQLWSAIDQMVAEHGFPGREGPPRMSERIRDAVLVARGEIPAAATALDMDPNALAARIEELGLWRDLNRRLRALGLPELRRPAA